MKKISLFLFGFICLLGIAALAQVVVAVPSPSPVPQPTDVISQALELYKNFASLGIYAGSAAALALLINALKAFGLFDKLIPEKFQALVVAVIGVITIGLGSFAVSKSLPMALGAGISSAAFAMLMHEIYQDFFPSTATPVAPVVVVVPASSTTPPAV